MSLTDMKLDCRPGFVTVVWTESRSQADPSLFRLGNCFPTSITAREVVFSVDFNDCNFRTMVGGILKLGIVKKTYFLQLCDIFVSFIGHWESANIHQ